MSHNPRGIKPVSYHLRWLLDMIDFFQRDTIKVPSGYRDQVLETKELLQNDVSGLVNTMLDFAISTAVDVDYRIETNNSNLDIVLNNWLGDINSSLIGKIPTGLDALAKEYFRERWKGSSCLLLRTFWENKDGYTLPTKLYFVDGEDILVDNPSETVTIGDEKYRLRIAKNESKPLPGKKNEMIFIQKPYSAWGTDYPVPFIILRGLFKNMKFLELLEHKGEMVVGKALEYLLTLKKGTERLTAENIAVYDKNDLDTVKEDFQKIVEDRKTTAGVPTYISNFDTEIAHLIPDYEKALRAELYGPMEKRILAGLGLVDIVQGAGSSRRESTLNPKPYMGEIQSGVSDFKALLKDVLTTVIEKNKGSHKKYFTNSKITEVRSTPLKIFLSEDGKSLLRSIYDRGGLSKQTFVELVGDVDYAVEVERRKSEDKRGETISMYPPVVQNQEQNPDPGETTDKISAPGVQPTSTKTGPESKNFNQSTEEFKCPYCEEVFDFEDQKETAIGVVQCPGCGRDVSLDDIEESYVPEITEEYIRLRQKDSNDFDKNAFRTIILSKSRGIHAIIGRLTGKTVMIIQSYLFEKTKWNVKDAQTWIKKHQGSRNTENEGAIIFSDEEFGEEEYFISAVEFEQAPYRTNNELPANVKKLPSGAQSIWRRVFNESYPKGEDYAFRVAWSVLKKVYKKIGDKWVRKSVGELEQSFKEIEIEVLLELQRLNILGKQDKIFEELVKED